MYVLTSTGHVGNGLSINNTETGSSVILDKSEPEIYTILEGMGYTFTDSTSEKYLNLHDELSIEVTKEIADQLAQTALKIRKPKRMKREQQEIKHEEEVEEVEITAMELLFAD